MEAHHPEPEGGEVNESSPDWREEDIRESMIRRLIRNLPGKLGIQIRRMIWWRQVQLLVDIVDSCPGACPSCPVGVQTRRDGHKMDIGTFCAILDKATREANLRKVQLYRWSDPLIHPKVHLFVNECAQRGLRASTSSFLQHTTCDWDELINSGLDEFRVSFSGWKKMHIYQKPARAERFVEKLEFISKLQWPKSVKKTMFFHEYKDNLDEREPARRLAEDNGFRFVSFPATFMMYERIIDGSYTEEDRALISLLPETPEENISRHKKPPKVTDRCAMQEDDITLDSYGQMQLCQMMYLPEFKMGSFLATPLKELRQQILAHPICPRCKAKGIGHYALIFGEPAVLNDPVKVADKDKYK
jgi:hypothetical protein